MVKMLVNKFFDEKQGILFRYSFFLNNTSLGETEILKKYVFLVLIYL